MRETRIVLVGVGGQGILFTTKALAETALSLGQEVIGSETHGMSQRGGSVVSHLKVGSFRSPLVRRGTADVLIALDKSEGHKSLDFLREGGTCFANAPGGLFPDPLLKTYADQRNLTCAAVDADTIARELGTPSVANTALLGFAISHEALPFSFDQVAETISVLSREHLRQINREALQSGRQHARNAPHDTLV